MEQLAQDPDPREQVRFDQQVLAARTGVLAGGKVIGQLLAIPDRGALYGTRYGRGRRLIWMGSWAAT